MIREYWCSKYGLSNCIANGMPGNAIYVDNSNWYRLAGTFEPTVVVVGGWPSENLRFEAESRQAKICWVDS